MITLLIFLTIGIALPGALFIWGMCRAAHNGDAAMDWAIAQAFSGQPSSHPAVGSIEPGAPESAGASQLPGAKRECATIPQTRPSHKSTAPAGRAANRAAGDFTAELPIAPRRYPESGGMM